MHERVARDYSPQDTRKKLEEIVKRRNGWATLRGQNARRRKLERQVEELATARGLTYRVAPGHPRFTPLEGWQIAMLSVQLHLVLEALYDFPAAQRDQHVAHWPRVLRPIIQRTLSAGSRRRFLAFKRGAVDRVLAHLVTASSQTPARPRTVRRAIAGWLSTFKVR